MKNREWLLSTAAIDTLTEMNKTLDRNTSCVCIMECFMQSHDAGARCAKYHYEGYGVNCQECIAAWLSEERSVISGE